MPDGSQNGAVTSCFGNTNESACESRLGWTRALHTFLRVDLMNNAARNVVSKFLPKLTGMSTEATLTRRVGSAFIVNMLGVGIAFGLQVLQARLLGVADYGQYIYALTWINFFVLFGKFGLDTAALQFIPVYQVKGDWPLLRGFIRRSSQGAIFFSTLLAVAIGLVVFVVQDGIEHGLASVFFLACVLLPFSVYLILQGAYLQAFRHIVISQMTQVIIRPVLIGTGFLISVFFLHVQISASLGMLLTLLATLATVLLAVVLIRFYLPSHALDGERTYATGLWTRTAFPMLLISSFNLMLNQTDIIMVGAILSTKDAGIYSAVNRLTMFIPFAIILVNSITAPIVSQLYAQKKKQQLQRMMTYVAWGSFLFSAPIFAGIIAWNQPLLSLYGAEFVPGSQTLVILAVSRLLIALTGSVGYLMSMSGHQRQAAYILGGSAVLNVVLNVILIPIFRLEGAAMATLITTALWTTTMVVVAKRMTGIDVSVFVWEKGNETK
jgi:O-antigen/teichoic acid export membrane protein